MRFMNHGSHIDHNVVKSTIQSGDVDDFLLRGYEVLL